MKNDSSLPLYNSDNPPKEQKEKSSEQTSESKSPYLKAILTAKTKLFTLKNDVPLFNSDRIAALRYIKHSAFLRKLNFDKMSC
jgi:hypothetical protein